MSDSAQPRHRGLRRRDRIVKRAVDLLLGGTALVVLSPVLVAIAVLIRVTDGAPVLFRQVRPGYKGRTFTILKFRTMRSTRPGEVWYQTDDVRVTKLGAVLRRTSLDELPELINVLKGEMSLVGPRPLLVEYLETYSAEEARRHDVRPGITGWAAVNGRHTVQFDQRLQYDIWYVDNWSLRLDLRIMWMTVLQVVKREDVTTVQDGSVGFRLPDADPTETGSSAATEPTPLPDASGPSAA